MATHKFKLGQSVFLQPTAFNRIAAFGAYEVTKQLPERTAGSNIKSKVQVSPTKGS